MINRFIVLFCVVLISLFAFVRMSKNNSQITDKKLVWMTSLDEAMKLSEKSKKPILANFTGSDWCGWCVKLSKEVFDTSEFKIWAQKNVILLELDYPRNKPQTEAIKQQNAGLQQAFKVQGFPTIWVFNLTKDDVTKKYNITPIGKTGYVAGGTKAFTDTVDSMIANFKLPKLEKIKP